MSTEFVHGNLAAAFRPFDIHMYLIILAKLSCGDGFKKILLDNSRNILGRASKALFLTFQGPKNPPVLRSVIIRYFSPWRGS